MRAGSRTFAGLSLILGLVVAVGVGAQSGSPTSPVAEVGTSRIDDREFQETLRNIEAIYKRDNGSDVPDAEIDEFRRSVLEQLIRQRLMRAEATRRGLTVSITEAERFLRQDPYFSPGGQFDDGRWAEFSTNPQAYDPAIRNATELLSGRRLFDQTQLRLTPSDEDLYLYYQRNSVRARISALLIDETWFANETDLNADAIRAFYDSVQTERSKHKSANIDLIVISFPGTETQSSASKRSKQETEARADSVLTALAEGSSFDEIAQEFGGIRDGETWATGQTTGLFYEDLELGDEALSAQSGDVLSRSVALPGGFGVIRVSRLLTAAIPPLGSIADLVIRDYEAEQLSNWAQLQMDAVRLEYPDSFLTICTTWSAALIDTSLITIKYPSDKKLESWYKDNSEYFAQLDSEGRGLVTPEFEEIQELALEQYISQLKTKDARKAAEKISKAWAKGKRDKKQEKKAYVWYELTTSPEMPASSSIPPAIADSASSLAVGTSRIILTRSGIAVFAVSERDSLCPLSDELALARTETILSNKRTRERETRARALYESHRERYLSAFGYRYTAVEIQAEPSEVINITGTEVERYYQEHLDDFGDPPRVRVKHLLISVRDLSEDGPAFQRATELLEAAESGADFDSLIVNFSDDPTTRDNGGDTGELSRTQTPTGFEPFMEIAFSLAPGQMGGPVRTPVGYHILRCVDVIPGNLQNIDNIRSNISSRIARARADSLALAISLEATRTFKTQEELLEWAETNDLSTFQTTWRPGTRGIGPTVDEDLQADLQAMTEPGMLGHPYLVVPRYVVVHLDSIVPPVQATWEEARVRALSDVDRERRMKESIEAGQAMVQELRGGVPWDVAAAPWGGGTADLILSRGSVIGEIGSSPELDSLVFGQEGRRTEPGGSESIISTQGAFVYQLDDRLEASEDDFRGVVDSLRSRALERSLYEYFEDLKVRYPVKIIRSDLQLDLPPPPPLVSWANSEGIREQ